MIGLDLAVLDTVIGGEQSSTQVQVPGASYSSSTSDYRHCVDTVTRMTAQQYPDTRWFGFIGRDRNAGQRAEATMRNMREVCGPPPQ
ncbi:MAG TPA: hypothetical protein VIV11_14405 [Kofleriaceae bacterium]